MQDEVNQEDSEQNEVDGMKKGADLVADRTEFHFAHHIKPVAHSEIKTETKR